MKNLSTIILTLSTVMLMVSCDPSYNSYNVSDIVDSSDGANGDNPIVTTPEITPEVEVPKVCDEVVDRLEMNLEASLSILNDAFSKHNNEKNHLKYYLDSNNVTVLKESFLVEQIDVAPRLYSEGVVSLEHESIIDPRHNDELSEYYSLSYDGYIHTESSTYEGTYQIGLLSDDGVILNIGGEDIISNPGNHAPTFNCADNVVTFKAEEPLSIKLDYHQGPRSRVANTLMWRKVDINASGNVEGVDRTKCNRGNSSVSSMENLGWEIIPRDVLFRDIKTCK